METLPPGRARLATKPAAKFPANREINREFRKIGSIRRNFVSDQRAHSMPYSGIPYATERERDAVIAVRRHLHSTYQYVGSSPIPTELMRRNELPLCVGNVLDHA
jgi:hypothetical protein